MIHDGVVGHAIMIQISTVVLPLGVVIVKAVVELNETELQIMIHRTELSQPASVVVMISNSSRV